MVLKIKESGCIENGDDLLKIAIALQSYDLQQAITNPTFIKEDDINELMHMEYLRLRNNKLNFELLRKELRQKYYENIEPEDSDGEDQIK